jgi:2-keto-4-pentenoate hydratase/2-oxohepta-3-ene-1,7-dioic acid hydratase in catechol pathway
VRIVRASFGGGISFGVLEGDEIAELDGPPIGELSFSGKRAGLKDARLLAPVLPSKIIGVSMNYRDHLEEAGMEAPAAPSIFLKPSTAVVGPGEAIRKPAVCERLDYEGELVVVVQGLVRNADVNAAAGAILGYTCGNDVTARDLQPHDFTVSKSFDTFAPLGPWIETDVDPSALDIEVRLNGEARQRSSTKNLVFSPAELVSYISNVMTLLPGDCIFTGTPPGPGPMEPGDTVEVTIDGIGTLPNRVA